ncbi:MAG: hypothetical protein KDK56_05155 [Simkania sp.]|nr:hypothetical protein [Simkania sp.]
MQTITEGVLTGCNEHHEWMLKTWWHYYTLSNCIPVTFVDFGMTKSARMWCEKRAPVITVSLPEVTPKEKIDPQKIKAWDADQTHSNYWSARPLWFAKPQALLQSPYEKTAWIDLDTFVIKPITPLIQACEKTGIALVPETEIGITRGRKVGYYGPNESVYNMGIISYKKSHPFLKTWADACLTKTDQFLGDQDLFAKLAHDEKLPIHVLSRIYNWRLCDGMQEDVVIIHLTHRGKQVLYTKLPIGLL